MVVASILMAMGMMMLPPVQISMPFKLILFVLVDGWGLLIKIYTPFENGHPLPASPDHAMIWFWIGAMALLTPITLFCFGKFFMRKLSVEAEK